MTLSPSESLVIELTKEINREQCVLFDPEAVRLEGVYRDQISAYRAKRIWIQALERCFLLEQDHDFSVCVASEVAESRFTLTCHFMTACARYAFWRLTNHQAPEAQYIIETAHIPRSESHHDAFLEAPDLRSIYDEPMILGGNSLTAPQRGALGALIDRIAKKFGV